MQLDKTRIPIKERGYLNLLDLALTVVRRHALGLLVTSLVGAVPFALLNYWMLSDVIRSEDAFDYGESLFSYVMYMAALVVWELPLASSFATLYLGQALFLERPDAARLVRDWFRALPQLFVVQVIMRGVLTLVCITWIVLFWTWPYLNEIILLERNPLTGKKGAMTTFRRCSALHRQYGGDLIGRFFAAIGLGGLWVLALLLCILWGLMTVYGGELETFPVVLQVWLPVALWTVVSYFNVVRFLSYLDLRIRGEGWEIELRMRAEAQRLKSQLA
jgi:hypothetical protein